LVNGTATGQIANPDLKWEEQEIWCWIGPKTIQ
jgi:hypothetical protein